MFLSICNTFIGSKLNNNFFSVHLNFLGCHFEIMLINQFLGVKFWLTFFQGSSTT